MNRLPLAAVVLLAAAAAAPGQAPPKRPVAVDDLYRLDAPRDTVLSPDGSKLAYSRAWIDPDTRQDRTSLWLVDGRREAAKPLEPGEPDARSPVFSPDGKWIAFLSTRPRPQGWKQTTPVPAYSDPACDVWLIPTAGGPAVPLAGPDKPYGRVFNDGFYGRIAFSPDGKKLVFVADDGADVRTDAEVANDVRVAREDQGEGYTGYRPAQVWVATFAEKADTFAAATLDSLTAGDVWYGDPQWSPDGKTLVVVANKTADRESARYSINKNFDLWAIDVASKRVRQLTTNPGPDVSPRFSPGGDRIAYLSTPRRGPHRDAFNLSLLGTDGDQPRHWTILDNHAVSERGGTYPAYPLPADCWDGTGHLVLQAEGGVNTPTARVDLYGPDGAEHVTPPPNGPGQPQRPQERAARRAALTPPGNAFFAGRTEAKQGVVRWTAHDGLALEGVLTTPPPGVAKPPYKLVVWPHGGPHSRTTLGFDFTAQVFAGAGYAVFQPNFRGSSGYGRAFIDADRHDFGGGDARDVLTGVDHLVKEGVADPDRLFLYGTSYGGYMTTSLVGQTTRFRAAVPVNAVTDLNMMWGLSDIQSWTEWEFGGKPWEVPDQMRRHSPISLVHKVKTPTLVLHARDDRRVPLPMGVAYHRALVSRGVATGLVVYPDEGHGIRQPRHREDVLRRTLDWFAKHDKTP